MLLNPSQEISLSLPLRPCTWTTCFPTAILGKYPLTLEIPASRPGLGLTRRHHCPGRATSKLARWVLRMCCSYRIFLCQQYPALLTPAEEYHGCGLASFVLRPVPSRKTIRAISESLQNLVPTKWDLRTSRLCGDCLCILSLETGQWSQPLLLRTVFSLCS